MTLPKEFWDKLPLRRDEELREMLRNPAGYQPEAIAAAQAEWERRGLPPERVADLELKDRAEALIAQEPLSWAGRLFAFMFALTLWPIICALYYSGRGYKRKAREFLLSAAACIVTLFVLGVLFSVLKLGQ